LGNKLETKLTITCSCKIEDEELVECDGCNRKVPAKDVVWVPHIEIDDNRVEYITVLLPLCPECNEEVWEQ